MDRRSMLASAMFAAGAAATTAEAAEKRVSGSRHATGALQVEHEGKATPALLAALKSIAAYADLHRRGYGLPGLTLVCTGPDGFTGYVRSGYAEVERKLPLRADHLFQIGSISKSFVAMCIHQLAAEGKFALTDDVRTVLPDVQLGPEPPINLIQMMEHSTGLPDNAPLFPHTPDGKLWSAFKPGTAWSYSNTCYDLLGKIVERFDKRELYLSIEARIMKPLGMTSAHGRIVAADREKFAVGYLPWNNEVDARPHGRLTPGAWVNVTFGAGCVSATARDMEKWVRYLAAAGQGHGAPLLPDAAARRFTSPGVAAPGWGMPGAHYGAGLAHVTVEGRTLLHHTGGMVTFSSAIHVDPKAGVGCFASTNSGQQNYRPREVTAYAAAVLRAAVAPEPGLAPKPAPIAPDKAPTPPAPWTGAVDPQLAPYVGRYENDDPWNGPFTVVAKGDKLFLDGEAELERHPEGYWTVKEPGSTERLWFSNMINGRLTTATLSGTDFLRRDI